MVLCCGQPDTHAAGPGCRHAAPQTQQQQQHAHHVSQLGQSTDMEEGKGGTGGGGGEGGGKGVESRKCCTTHLPRSLAKHGASPANARLSWLAISCIACTQAHVNSKKYQQLVRDSGEAAPAPIIMVKQLNEEPEAAAGAAAQPPAGENG